MQKDRKKAEKKQSRNASASAKRKVQPARKVKSAGAGASKKSAAAKKVSVKPSVRKTKPVAAAKKASVKPSVRKTKPVAAAKKASVKPSARKTKPVAAAKKASVKPSVRKKKPVAAPAKNTAIAKKTATKSPKSAAKKTTAAKKAAPVSKRSGTAKPATAKPATAKVNGKTRKRIPAKRKTTRRPSRRPSKAKKSLLLHSKIPAGPYMNPKQQKYFREILTQQRTELLQQVDSTVRHIQYDTANYPDETDRASREEGFGLELKARDRERKLIRKIDRTIGMIERDEYGYCEECGEGIGLARLQARPTADLCIHCKEISETKERQEHG